MKYYLIAGEASGDLHAANLMKSLKEQDSEAEFRFFGGDLMAAQGGTMVKHFREMAYMGFIPVLMNLDKVFRNIGDCKKDIAAYRPDVVILVDYPGFNLKIAGYVKKELHIPVHYYISPKIWAWKEYRIKSIRRYVDKMYSILPFEVLFYQKHRYRINYVGNPTVDEMSVRSMPDETFTDFIAACDLPDKPIIALLSGSRVSEIKDNLSVMLKAASAFPGYQMVIAGAPAIDEELYKSISAGYEVSVVFGKTYRLLQQSSAALVTSGTATLETALLRVPQVVCYYMGGGKLTYNLFKWWLNVKFVSLVNLIADDEVVKELLACYCTPENVEAELQRLLYDNAYRKKILAGYGRMAALLGEPGAPDRTARDIIKTMKESR